MCAKDFSNILSLGNVVQLKWFVEHCVVVRSMVSLRRFTNIVSQYESAKRVVYRCFVEHSVVVLGMMFTRSFLDIASLVHGVLLTRFLEHCLVLECMILIHGVTDIVVQYVDVITNV